ncbi:ABC transporter ATP-binding protein [Pseudorhodoplanes sp.]|uniref:ABC transporter ATP-binding protein n=1 Tax=Pseudorhodoplanes sp. TaxID=1934341 RepID=UPI003D10E7BB
MNVEVSGRMVAKVGRAPVIELRDVSKVHKTARQMIRAVCGANIRIEAGEFVSLLGPSGCGKSTLLGLVAGLDQPTSGTITFDGLQRSTSDRRVAVNFQEPALFPWRDTKRNVTIALENRGLGRAQVDAQAERALEAVGLSQFQNIYPSHLSGGMKQRVMLARLLAMNAPVMLMDEPFAALDAITREQMQDLVTRLYSARRFSIIFVTHSIEEALFASQRVIVMCARPGRIVHEVKLDEGYPRTFDWRLSDKVAALRRELHQLMRDLDAGGSGGEDARV